MSRIKSLLRSIMPRGSPKKTVGENREDETGTNSSNNSYGSHGSCLV